ncbi:hypothetical protein B0H14DRAFT_2360117 [Mycena olivaceomarginata]|nr:hypothetical protein B0H14DRAFT_2360117 [Mycena olivaceomarginata]
MPDNDLREKVAVYFHDALIQPVKKILPLLPQIMPGWGKVRIRDGDSIRTASALVRGEKMVRVNSYIRSGNKIELVPQICYGQLQQILVCTLLANSIFRVFSGQTRLLAVITPCSTAGRDAAKHLVSYTQTNNTIVTDLQAVSAGIGRMATRNKWVIVDRTGGYIRPEFVEAEEEDGEE